MRGNSFGKLFTIHSFGESHGKAMGVVIDGMPANIKINPNDLHKTLLLRAPGSSKEVTDRKELDLPIILSGIYKDKTLGTPICIIVENKNQRSIDYLGKNQLPRRYGHADLTYKQKFNHVDPRGSGRASGRETLSRVIGGYFAKKILPKNLKIKSLISQIGQINLYDLYSTLDFNHFLKIKKNRLHLSMPNKEKEISKYLLDLKKQGDSVGGEISVVIQNCPKALGEPCFDKLKAELSKAIMSIGACVGFEFGLGSELSKIQGQTAAKNLNHFGGIEGGISNGEIIFFKCFFKPTSTVGKKALEGRHDPCILPRVIPVIEAMVYMVLADHQLRQSAYN